MTAARYLIGDTRRILAQLPDNSVDLVLTSPPFLALRSYLPADHPDKPLEMGSEATPGEFIDSLLDVVEACQRVLAPHGSLCVELGDTYAGSGGAGGDYNEGGLREDAPKFTGSALSYRRTTQRKRAGGGAGGDWPVEKSLCLIPELFRFALAYGFNPLTGRQTERWRVRNVVRWCRPNPPVGALADKFRPATSDLVIATMARDRYFDLDAVRTPLTEPGAVKKHSPEQRNAAAGWDSNHADIRQNEAGAPPLDWWRIPTQPYEGSHYATWPEQLCVVPIKAMCPQRVCQFCGEPSRRIVGEPEYVQSRNGVTPSVLHQREGTRVGANVNQWATPGRGDSSVTRITTSAGWTDCGHDAWRTGIVLDPFAGSGTTLAVATGHGRDATGIDLDPRNALLAIDRIGPLLCTVEDRRGNIGQTYVSEDESA